MHTPHYTALTEAQLLQLDGLAVAFEIELRAGGPAAIEVHLDAGPQELRLAMLAELVAMEVEYIRSSGATPSVDEYTKRFPQDRELIVRLFVEVGDVQSDASPDQQETCEYRTPSDVVDAFGETLPAKFQDLSQVPAHTSLRPERSQAFDTLPLSAQPRRVLADDPSFTSPSGEPSEPATGPDYLMKEVIGQGGMGTVHLARQVALGRDVALKRISRANRQSDQLQDEFLAEARVTGILEHPNIVPVYEVGTSPEGESFYSMKNIKGQPWNKSIDRLSLDENLAVLLDVCDAIAFAHAEGVIHRDLKPQNIMTGGFGEVLVLDWGLAVLVGSVGEAQADCGGTPAYMAPEMVNPPNVVGVRSDVYLLGGLLFRILTGIAPHSSDTARDCLISAAKNVIDSPDEELVRNLDPSGELLAVATRAMATRPEDRYASVTEFQQAIRGYLAHAESIELASRAGERLDDGRRSGSYEDFSRARFGFEAALDGWPDNVPAADGLQETRRDYARTAFDRGDLELALSLLDESESDQAEFRASVRASIVERDTRQQSIRRLRRVSLATSVTVAVVAIVAAAWINLERSKADRERNNALIAQQQEAAQREIAQQQEHEAQEQRQAAIKARELAETSADEARRNLKVAERNAYRSDMLYVKREWDEANIGQLKELLNRYRNRDDLKGFEWRYWKRLVHSDLLTLPGHTDEVWSVAFSPDGTRLVSASRDETVRVWDVITGDVTLTLRGHVGPVFTVAFSPDGSRIASGGADDTVQVWDAVTGQPTVRLEGHDNDILGVAFSPDGTQLASASVDNTLKVWNPATGLETRTLRGHTGPVRSVIFSPDGTRIVSGGGYRDRSIKVWDATTGRSEITLKDHAGHVNSVAFSRDGTRLASASTDKTVKVWDTGTWGELLTLTGHTREVRHVAFSPDGAQLASASFDYTIKLWDAVTGQEAHTLKGHSLDVSSVSFSPDGTRLASASYDKTVKVWDAGTAQGPLTLRAHTDKVRSVAFSPDGTQLASASSDDTVKVYVTGTGRETLTLRGHAESVNSVAFSPDGTRLASASNDETIKLWDAASGQETLTLEGHADWVHSVAFSPDGTRLASAGSDNTVKVWDVATGKSIRTLKGHTATVLTVVFSPDGTRIASAGIDRTLKLWNAATGRETRTLRGHTDRVTTVAFSRDGTQLASGSRDTTVMVWDAFTGKVTHTLTGHARWVSSVSFSPDGRRLVSVSGDRYEPGKVMLWDTTTGQETLTLEQTEHTRQISSVAFSPDGTRLASASWDKTVKVWDARPWTPELQSTHHQARRLLMTLRENVTSLEELRAAIRSNESVDGMVRKQALDWSELFWKPVAPSPIVGHLVRQLTNDELPTSALEFDGSTQHVSIPSLRYDGSHPITLEAFVTPDVLGNIALGNTQHAGIALGLERGTYNIHASNGSRYSYVYARENAAKYQRVHVAGMFDDTMLRIFVDGKFQRTGPINGTFKGSKFPMTIGASPSPDGPGVDYPFNGLIDQVRISKTARYTDDFKVPARFEADEDTLAVYHFDEGKGEVLGDASGNGHDGQIRGAKWVTSQAIRRRAALGLTELDRHGVAALADALTHQNPEVRIEAASALGTIGPTASAAIAALKAAAADEDKSVQDAAELALSQIESTPPNE